MVVPRKLRLLLILRKTFPKFPSYRLPGQKNGKCKGPGSRVHYEQSRKRKGVGISGMLKVRECVTEGEVRNVGGHVRPCRPPQSICFYLSPVRSPGRIVLQGHSNNLT